MITKQTRLSSIGTYLPWRYPTIDANETGPFTNPGFVGAHRASLLGLYSGFFTADFVEPEFTFSDRIFTIGVLNHNISWEIEDLEKRENLQDLRKDLGRVNLLLQYNTGSGDTEINQIFHDNFVYNGDTPKVYDLQDLDGELLNHPYSKELIKVKSFTIYNVSGDDLPVFFSGSDAFGDMNGFPTEKIIVGAGGNYHVNAGIGGWDVGSGNNLITVGDGTQLNCRYELVILGEVSG